MHDVADRIVSEQGHREIEDVVDALARLRPTKIAVEVEPDRSDVLVDRYLRWRELREELPPNEVFQLSYRLADRLDHGRVFGIDYMGTFYDPDVERLTAMDSDAASRWQALMDNAADEAAAINRLLSSNTVGEVLRHLNSTAQLERTLNMYFRFLLPLLDDSGTPGPDMIANWYQRNLRIAANLLKESEPRDEWLVVFGVGHVPLLRDFLGRVSGVTVCEPFPR